VASPWWSPNGSARGEVVPIRTVRRADGVFCRDYRETLVVAGREYSRTGRACRTASGEWKRAPARA